MRAHPSLLDDWIATLPASVRGVSARLESEGFEAWLVGESLLRTLLGLTPEAFELATTAPPERSLELFPQAIPTHLERGVVSVPRGPIPVDLSSFRLGPSLAHDLAHRDFTLLAMAYRPETQTFLDPYDGQLHLAARELRCVGEPRERFAEDPLRMLRAARLVSEYGFAPQADLEAAIATACDAWKSIEAPRLCRELARLLLGNHPAEGLGLLRRTGFESRLIRHTQPDSGALIATLPRALPVRMAAWLRGTRPRPLLRQLRFGVERSRQVESLLEHHPLDRCVNPARDRVLSKLVRQVAPPDLEALFAMRAWELQHGDDATDATEATDARRRLAAIRSGIERIRLSRERTRRRTKLALDGTSIMQLLGCEPGREVGAALRFLSERVDADPSLNQPEALRQALLEQKALRADEKSPPRSLPES